MASQSRCLLVITANMFDKRHTFRLGSTRDDRCPLCESRDCDHRTYSKRYVAFVRAHWEAFQAAYLDGNAQASRPEMERLSREYRTLPPRHVCSCWCPSERRGGPPCVECKRLRSSSVRQDVAVEIGRTAMVHPPTPLVTCLDLESGYA